MGINLKYERSYPTPYANSSLLPLLLMSLLKQRIAPRVSSKAKKEYDYIVVGSGAAGAVVANRLSEIPCVSVLLLEAGGNPPTLTEVPALFGLYENTDIDWQYKTVPQIHTLTGLQYPAARGKVLGGSTILNALVYVRCSQKNYDNWAAQGSDGWSWKDVFPYFLKLEDYNDLKYLFNGYHSVGGPVTVEHIDFQKNVHTQLLKAAQLLGYPIDDANDERQTGFWNMYFSMRDGQRCSTAKAYLVPAENRTNLDILTNAFVKKIVIKNKRAVGVIYDHKGTTYRVRAKREVIVSAGIINTPKLLLLSGIGPAEQLQKFNISVVADLPVGKNLHGHFGTNLYYFINKQASFEKSIRDPKNILLYIKHRTGPLTSSLGIPLAAFLDGSQSNDSVDYPTFQLDHSVLDPKQLKIDLGITDESFQQMYGQYSNSSVYACEITSQLPLSQGTITLNTSDPYDPPLIDPNYYSDPRDIQYVLKGMKVCQSIASSEPMKELNISSFAISYPGCSQYSNNEDLYWECYAKSVLNGFRHVVGTAKMGSTSDSTTVLDPKLRVKGIQGLRVADASIMPIIPTGNINVPTMMVGEKASDLIKETIRCK